MIATALSTTAAIALAVFAYRTAPAPAAVVPYVLSLPLPDGVGFNSYIPPALRLAISPDGRRLAFVGLTDAQTGRRMLFVQPLDESLAKPIAGGEDGIGPFWSPDSRALGFSIREVVRKLEGENSTPVVVTGAVGVGRFVDEHRMLFYSRGGRIQELIPPATQARDVLVPSKAGEEYGYPVPLPGGRRMLFSYRNVFAPDTEGIYIANLDGSDRRQLLPNREAINAAYANGALLYVRNQSIVAQSFDVERGTLSGEPTVVADSVALAGGSFATAAFSVSANGTLVYEPGTRGSFSRLQWLSRAGAVIATLGDDADYSNVVLSPDGTRLAASVMDSAQRTRDIWVVDVARGVRQRLTFDPSEERSAVWTPDSARLIFNSRRLNLYARAANGGGAEEPLQTDNRSKDPNRISPDGKRLLYRRSGDGTGNDVWMMTLDGERKSVAILETPFNENYASFSPDGRSIVYASDESGEFEVYVLSLDGTGGKARISTAGGTFPRWRGDGHEIVYLDPGQQVMSVVVSGAGPTFAAAAARPLFRIAAQPGPGVPFDVTSDGQRFIVNTEIPSRGTPAFKVVVNWPALMRR